MAKVPDVGKTVSSSKETVAPSSFVVPEAVSVATAVALPAGPSSSREPLCEEQPRSTSPRHRGQLRLQRSMANLLEKISREGNKEHVESGILLPPRSGLKAR
jgi:hypothetical protein